MDNRRESSVNLKNVVSKDISMFMIYINKYLKNPDDIIAYEVIKEEISIESKFAAFKRQIIRENDFLYIDFKQAL